MNRKTIVHVTQSVSRLGGGLFESVRHLSQSVQSVTQAPLTVLGLEDRMSHEDAGRWAPLTVRTHPIVGPRMFGYSPELGRDLERTAPDLVHLHGLWRHTSIAVWQWARRTGRPYVVSPHGMLEPWALQQSRWKKWLALRLYQGPCLRHAACIRATSRLETESIRKAGVDGPVALIPNGVELPRDLPGPRNGAGERYRRALFLSRIHPKKGLLNLVRAWAVARPMNWRLVIAGPDELGHLAEAKEAVGLCGLAGEVLFAGEAWGEEKMRLYFDSDLFVLPSFSENFGLVVAEALGCGLPVITTRATPWSELEEHRCGWWIETGVEPLTAALSQACSLSSADLGEMGMRGRRLVQANYAWEPIGRQMVEIYHWMLGTAARPACVLEP